MDSDYKDKKHCEICSKEFGLTNIRHKCKRCGLIICSDDTKGQAVIIGYVDNSPHKVCKLCSTEIEFQRGFKAENNTSWATDSKFGNRWLSLHDVSSFILNIDKDFHYYLEYGSTAANCTQSAEEIDIDAINGRFDKEYYSFSLLEFLHYGQLGHSKEAIRTNVINVLKSFIGRYPDIGYQAGMAHLATFLLCLFNEKNSFFIMSFIIEKILPSNFYGNQDLPMYGCLKEISVLTKAAINYVIDAKDQVKQKKLLEFFDKTGLFLLQSFLIDVLNFEAVVYLWNRVIEQNDYREFEKMFLDMCNQSDSRFMIYDVKNMNFSKYSYGICKFISKKYLEHFSKGEVDESLRPSYEQEFLQNELIAAQNERTSFLGAIEKLNKVTPIELKVLGEALDKFIHIKKSSKSKSNPKDAFMLSKVDFVSFLTPAFQNISIQLNENESSRLFDRLDHLKTDHVSHRTLLTCLTLMMPLSFNDKVTAIFSLYQLSYKDHVNKVEAQEFIDAYFDSVDRNKPLQTN